MVFFPRSPAFSEYGNSIAVIRNIKNCNACFHPQHSIVYYTFLSCCHKNILKLDKRAFLKKQRTLKIKAYSGWCFSASSRSSNTWPTKEKIEPTA